MSKKIMSSVLLRYGLSLFPAACALILLNLSEFDWLAASGLTFLAFLALSILFITLIPLTKNIRKYYLSVSLAVFFGFVSVMILSDRPVIQTLLLSVYLIEIILLEPYPANLIETTALLGAVLITLSLILNFRNTSIVEISGSLITVAFPGLILSISGCLMVKYREIAVDLVDEQNRLADSIVSLTRTNSAYMNFAFSAQEKGMHEERQRITRDIHDIVGYTLTNNMMLMEAAQDIMMENALALPTIIETARNNAEEGLSRIRAALYRLRAEEDRRPAGLGAVVRLCGIFQQAAGITVNCHLGNTPLSLPSAVDSAVFHLVQESLVNSFRHGRASAVNIFFRCEADMLHVIIEDDGSGAEKIVAGIGISGMRERIENLEGRIETQSRLEGFQVKALIPLKRNSE